MAKESGNLNNFIPQNEISVDKSASDHRGRKQASDTAARLASNDSGRTAINGWRNWGAFQLSRFTFTAAFTKDFFAVDK